MRYEAIEASLTDYFSPEQAGDLARQTRLEVENDSLGLADPQKLAELNSSYQIYPEDVWQLILQAALESRQNSQLWPKTVLLYQLFQLPESEKKDELVTSLLASFAEPQLNGASWLACDFAPLLALLPAVPPLVAALQKRQLPRQIIQETLSEFPDKVKDFQLRLGRPGSRTYVTWLQRFTDGDIVRIGRFNMELRPDFTGRVSVFQDQQKNTKMLMKDARLHRSGRILGCAGFTDETGSYQADLTETKEAYIGHPVGPDGLARAERIKLAKSNWQQILTTGEAAVSVHIPAWLSLDPAYCQESYRKTRQVLARHYPEFAYKAIYCHSWMIDPQLTRLLGHTTNITRFQQQYLPYPTLSQGRGVADFVFARSMDSPPEQWPADTSLRKVIKEHYLAGKYIYEIGGILSQT